jgi:hypothetical protein
MRKLTADERIILAEATRIKQRLNEGPGAGVEFIFEAVDFHQVEPTKGELSGKLEIRSYYDASYVVAQENKPLGTYEFEEREILAAIEEETTNSYNLESLEVRPLTRGLKVMFGAGWARAKFDGTLETIVDCEIDVLVTDSYGDEEWLQFTSEITIHITLDPIAISAYEALDDPDRWKYEDEEGNLVELNYVDEEDATFYVF